MRAAELFTDYLSITDQEVLRALLAVTKLRRLKRDELLIRAGQIQTEVVFLSKGILRGFLLNAEGHDTTDCFAFRPGDAAMATIDLNMPSPISIEALTETEVYCIPMDSVLRLMDQNVSLVQLYNHLLQNAFQAHWQAKIILCQCPAMERYQWFLKEYPGLIDQVRNKYVATFLGMTPVTLSRLRTTLRQNAEVSV